MALAWKLIRPRRMSPEDMERARRQGLAANGRIIDGIIVDTPLYHAEETAAGQPALISYRYSLAGVAYECAQDVSLFIDELVGLKADLPVSVKYDPRNPANSIVVAENWSGLSDSGTFAWTQKTGTTNSAHL